MGKLNGNSVPANLVPVKAGDEYAIKPNLFARVFPTKHSRGSVGFTVLEKQEAQTRIRWSNRAADR